MSKAPAPFARSFSACGRVSRGILASLFALGACAGGGPDIPAGAVPIGESVYAVPLAAPDPDGCQAYRLWSSDPERMVVMALHYRRADGTFTANREEADCPPLRSQ